MGQTPNGGFTPADLFLMSGVGKLKKAQVKDNDSITAEQINCWLFMAGKNKIILNWGKKL